MKTFEYRGFDLAGQVARGLIEAANLKEARDRLTTRGVLPEDVREAGRPKTSSWRFRASLRLDLPTRAAVYRELSALLRAGISLVPALQIVIHAADQPAHASILSLVRDRIRDGSGLSEALLLADPRLAIFERAALTAGERSSTLDL